MQINFHPLWFTAWDTQNYLLDSVSHFPIIILIIMHILLYLYLYVQRTMCTWFWLYWLILHEYQSMYKCSMKNHLYISFVLWYFLFLKKRYSSLDKYLIIEENFKGKEENIVENYCFV